MPKKAPGKEGGGEVSLQDKVLRLVTREHSNPDRKVLETALHLREKVRFLSAEQARLVDELTALYDLLTDVVGEDQQEKRKELLLQAEKYFVAAREHIMKQFPTPKDAQKFTGVEKPAEQLTAAGAETWLQGEEAKLAPYNLSKRQRKDLAAGKKQFEVLVGKLKTGQITEHEILTTYPKAQREVVETVRLILKKQQDQSPAFAAPEPEESEVQEEAPRQKRVVEQIASPDVDPQVEEESVETGAENETDEQIFDRIKAEIESGAFTLEKAKASIELARTVGGQTIRDPRNEEDTLATGCYWYAFGENGLPPDAAKALARTMRDHFTKGKAEQKDRQGEARFNEIKARFLVDNPADILAVADEMIEKAKSTPKGLMSTFKATSPEQQVSVGAFWFFKMYKTPYKGIDADAKVFASQAAAHFKDKEPKVEKSKEVPLVRNKPGFNDAAAQKNAEEAEYKAQHPEHPAPAESHETESAGAHVFSLADAIEVFNALSAEQQKKVKTRPRRSPEEPFQDPAFTVGEARYWKAFLDNPDVEQAEAEALGKQAELEFRSMMDKCIRQLISKDPEQAVSTAQDIIEQAEQLEDREIFPEKGSEADSDANIVALGAFLVAKHFGGRSRSEANQFAEHAKDIFMTAEAALEEAVPDVAPTPRESAEPAPKVESVSQRSVENEMKVVSHIDPIFKALDEGEDLQFTFVEISRAAENLLSSPNFQDGSFDLAKKTNTEKIVRARYLYALNVENLGERKAAQLASETRKACQRIEKLQKPVEKVLIVPDEDEEDDADRRAASIAARRGDVVSTHYTSGVANEMRRPAKDRTDMPEVEQLSPEEKNKASLLSNLKRTYYRPLSENIETFTFKKITGKEADERDASRLLRRLYDAQVAPLVAAFEAADPKNADELARLEREIKSAVKDLDLKRQVAENAESLDSISIDWLRDGVKKLAEQEYSEKITLYNSLVRDKNELMTEFSLLRDSFPEIDQGLTTFGRELAKADAIYRKSRQPGIKGTEAAKVFQEAFAEAVQQAAKERNSVLFTLEKITGVAL